MPKQALVRANNGHLIYAHLRKANAKSMLLNTLDLLDNGKGSHDMLVTYHYLPVFELVLKIDF